MKLDPQKFTGKVCNSFYRLNCNRVWSWIHRSSQAIFILVSLGIVWNEDPFLLFLFCNLGDKVLGFIKKIYSLKSYIFWFLYIFSQCFFIFVFFLIHKQAIHTISHFTSRYIFFQGKAFLNQFIMGHDLVVNKVGTCLITEKMISHCFLLFENENCW